MAIVSFVMQISKVCFEEACEKYARRLVDESFLRGCKHVHGDIYVSVHSPKD
jgi:hypothetical protein